MAKPDQKEKFIELRAQGLSFEKIGKELSISTTSLVKWSNEFQMQISNMRAIQLEALREQFFLSKQARIEAFGKLLQRIRVEIENRDLESIETSKLMELFLKIHSAVSGEIEEITLAGVRAIGGWEPTEKWTA